MSVSAYFYIQITITFLAALTGILNYRKRNKTLLPVVIVLIAVFLQAVIAFLMGKYLRNNLPVDHFITPVMLGGWGFFFSQALEDPRVKKFALWATVFLIACSIVNTLLTGFNVSPWIVMRAVTIFNFILGGLLLMQTLDLSSKENIFTNSFFLIALAVVWFNMISSLNFFLYDFMKVHKPARQIINQIHWYSNYIYYSILLLAMLFQKKLNKDV
ncbi:MAG: hypothetical protein H7Y86_10620 [Rhizobacter sp.]|nr:hypothetical protein [Ferruginibacter sp.]